MIIINEKYSHLTPWLNSLPDSFSSLGEIIYKARNEIRRIDYNGLTFCVKRYHKPHFLNRIIYTYFRKPKAIRAYNNAQLLNSLGFSSPEEVACIICGRPLGFSYLVTLCSPLKRRFYEFSEHGIVGYEDLLDLLGTMAGRMNDMQLLHKDFSPGNILFDKVDGEWKIELVDINRMRFGHVSLRRGCHNLSRLWGDARLIDRVARAYARERGFDEQKCVDITLSEWHKFWKSRNI